MSNCSLIIRGTEEKGGITVRAVCDGTGQQVLVMLANAIMNVTKDFPGDRELFLRMLLRTMDEIEEQGGRK